jgi:rare lipoprotein A
MMLAATAIMLGCGLLSACERREAPQSSLAHARYTLGAPWVSNGCWFYPAENFAYAATGLAIVDAPRRRATRVTADGEDYDPALATAAHQTLQLPAVLHVRNLENGREVLLRVNDRGPPSPGRLLSVSPRAAQLLGMVPGRPTRVRVVEDELLSRDLLRRVQGAPPPEIAAAPVGAVQEQSLMPAGGGTRTTGTALPSAGDSSPAMSTGVLSDLVTMGPADPGQLWIDAGDFSQPVYARRLAARLAGTVRRNGRSGSAVFGVRVGPFSHVDQADAALDRARSAGVTGARIIVE